MRNLLLLSTFTAALLASSPAHAVLDCWGTLTGDTICWVSSVSDTAPDRSGTSTPAPRVRRPSKGKQAPVKAPRNPSEAQEQQKK
jgi:hypothetical protein